MKYSLYVIRVFSLRWEESLAFYRDTIGFELAFEDVGMGWAQFDLGHAQLGLERCSPDDPESTELVGRFVGASVKVEDINTAYETLVSKGVVFLGAPEQQPWGGILAHFKDPDGNVITLFGTPDA